MSQLLEKQRNARTMGGMECSCPDSTCLDSKTCIHQVDGPKLLNILLNWFLKATKSEAQTTSSGRSRNSSGGLLHHRHLNENNNQVNRHFVKTSMQNWWHPFCPQSFLRLTTGIIPSVQLIPRCRQPLEITVWCWLTTILQAVATPLRVVATRP